MKQYVSDHHLRVIGKGWEIRRELNRLASSAEGEGLMSVYTKTLPPIRVTIGSSNRTLSDQTIRELDLNETSAETPS
ncbi:hypothetical protein RB620_16480 [Paenibacillus sp. LHD-117]|uniref:hypothetical protein n=1 Tax=Paenibacillus sp. LHD-117 TaxID=3071412 RepID=UPI0027E064F1|nr:hypothetical protein [Paenibacillus sp. LHD-117]MDQ6421025.1 hypothetical protein [Paenibacillus sp. LHD-117]